MSATPRESRVPKVRDRIEIDVPGKGPHPAVVLEVETGMLVLAVGSTTLIDDVEIVAIDREPNLRLMHLRQGSKTIFYERHIHPVKWTGCVFPIWARCPAGVFDRLF